MSVAASVKGGGERSPELVASFADRAHFESAVTALKAAGFRHEDLSVLSSHQALEAAEPQVKSWSELLSAMVGEVKYVGPLSAAGFIWLATGPVGAALAAVIAAGVGGVAVKEFLDEISALPDTDAFKKALEAGDVLLWVRAGEARRQADARAILEASGARHVEMMRPAAR
jgi:hypothetical protein